MISPKEISSFINDYHEVGKALYKSLFSPVARGVEGISESDFDKEIIGRLEELMMTAKGLLEKKTVKS